MLTDQDNIFRKSLKHTNLLLRIKLHVTYNNCLFKIFSFQSYFFVRNNVRQFIPAHNEKRLQI